MNSVDRVRIALKEAGHPDTIAGFSASTHTAADAAAAIGCTVAQIAKSVVFRSVDQPVLVIASGRNRVDLPGPGPYPRPPAASVRLTTAPTGPEQPPTAWKAAHPTRQSGLQPAHPLNGRPDGRTGPDLTHRRPLPAVSGLRAGISAFGPALRDIP